MTKVFQYIEENAVKIIITVLIAWGLFFGILYVQGIKNDISSLKDTQTSEQSVQANRYNLNIQALLFIIEQLEEINKTQSFIIDQNRNNQIIAKKTIEENQKPSYEELKAHTVFIVGCTNKVLSDDKQIRYNMLEDSGSCWSGTGSIVKITETETYIITNNHVAGANETNVTLYIQDGLNKKVATVVKNHPYVDMAVIKVSGTLEGKTAIKKIGRVNIQDPIFIVGNPLHNKMVYTEGVMAGYTEYSLLLQAPCIFGNSGSAVYNSKGELVGLVYALQTYPGFLGIPMAQITHTVAVDNINIRPFLEDLGLYNE